MKKLTSEEYKLKKKVAIERGLSIASLLVSAGIAVGGALNTQSVVAKEKLDDEIVNTLCNMSEMQEYLDETREEVTRIQLLYNEGKINEDELWEMVVEQSSAEKLIAYAKLNKHKSEQLKETIEDYQTKANRYSFLYSLNPYLFVTGLGFGATGLALDSIADKDKKLYKQLKEDRENEM